MEITFDDMLNLERGLLITHHVWFVEHGEGYWQTEEMEGLMKMFRDFRGCNWFEFTSNQLEVMMVALNYRAVVEKTDRYEDLHNRLYDQYKTYLVGF